MKLLKIAFLSTTLMMGATFASADLTAEIVDEAARESQEKEVAFINASKAFAKNQKLVKGKLLEFSERYTGIVPEGVSTDSKSLDILASVKAAFEKLVAQRDELQSKLALANDELTTAAAANEKLTSEKTKLEEFLVEATAKLEAVTAEKEKVVEELEVAKLKVAAFSEKLEAAHTAAAIADKKVGEMIAKLTAELAAAQEEVNRLTAQAEELSAIKAKAEKSKREKEAALRTLLAIDSEIDDAIFEGQADGNGDANPFAELLKNADKLPTGVEGDVYYGSPRSEEGDFSPSRESDDSSLKPIREILQARDLALEFAASEVDEATKVEIATLLSELTKAQIATAASPFSGKGSKKKNEDAQIAARTKVRDLTAQLKALGVDVEATAAAAK